jgi:hypothetical protein
MFSVALSGLSFVNALVPGVLPFGQAQAENTPVCGLSRLDFVDLWFGAYLPDTNSYLCFLMLLVWRFYRPATAFST